LLYFVFCFLFFLCFVLKSFKMASMLVCFNLGLPAPEQSKQITYWLDYLNSSLDLSPLNSTPKWNIILVGVRADEQQDFSLTQNSHLITTWKKKWPCLPIIPKLFTVSALKSIDSVQQLLQFVEQECNCIFDQHAMQIPSSYQQFILKLQEIASNTPLIKWTELFNKLGPEMNMA
jgi:hypothetical protein